MMGSTLPHLNLQRNRSISTNFAMVRERTFEKPSIRGEPERHERDSGNSRTFRQENCFRRSNLSEALMRRYDNYRCKGGWKRCAGALEGGRCVLWRGA